MQYTDNEAVLIGGLISTYFFQPAVSASLKDAYSRVLEHLHQNALTFSDLQQIRKAVDFRSRQDLCANLFADSGRHEVSRQ